MQAEAWLPRSGLARAVLLGSIAFFLTFIWWPIFQTFWLSFQFKRPGEQYWVGIENYRTILFADPVFWKSLQVTFTYVLYTVPGDRRDRGQRRHAAPRRLHERPGCLLRRRGDGWGEPLAAVPRDQVAAG